MNNEHLKGILKEANKQMIIRAFNYGYNRALEEIHIEDEKLRKQPDLNGVLKKFNHK